MVVFKHDLNVVEFRLGNPHTFVLDLESHILLIAGDFDQRVAEFGVLQCILNHVDQDLEQSLIVSLEGFGYAALDLEG